MFPDQGFSLPLGFFSKIRPMHEVEIIIGKDEESYSKWNDRKLSQSVSTNEIFIPLKELSNHPGAIGCDPEINRQVVNQFTGYFPGLISDQYSYREGGNDHDQCRVFKIYSPADVFDQPQQNVKVFYLTVFVRNMVDFLLLHQQMAVLFRGHGSCHGLSNISGTINYMNAAFTHDFHFCSCSII